MKKISFLFSLCVLIHFADGQVLKKIGDRVKNKVDNNANNKVNNTVDKTVDDAMNPNKNRTITLMPAIKIAMQTKMWKAKVPLR